MGKYVFNRNWNVFSVMIDNDQPKDGFLRIICGWLENLNKWGL